MLRLLSSKARGCKDFCKPTKPCHVGIHWKALTEYSQRSNNLSGFSHFSGFLYHFVSAKIATSNIRVDAEVLSHAYLKISYYEIVLSWCVILLKTILKIKWFSLYFLLPSYAWHPPSGSGRGSVQRGKYYISERYNNQ